MSLDQYLPVLLFILVGIFVGVAPQVMGWGLAKFMGFEKPDAAKSAQPQELPTDVKEMQKRLVAAMKDRDEAVKRLDRFHKERSERLVVRVLEIDPASGKLVYYAPGRQEIVSQAQAEQLIAYEKRLAGEKDIFFTIQYPREAAKHPTETDLASYRDWFKNVPHGFEIPRPGP